MANAPRLRTGANTTDHLPSLRAERSEAIHPSLRMPRGLLRCARNDDQLALSRLFANQIHRRRPAQAKRDAGPITTGHSLRGSHRTASLKTSDTAYGSPRPRGRHRFQYRRQTPRLANGPRGANKPPQPSLRGASATEQSMSLCPSTAPLARGTGLLQTHADPCIGSTADLKHQNAVYPPSITKQSAV
jgi:hypothetical protein